MVQVMQRCGGHTVDIETVRPYMRRGFPWHTPDVPNSPGRPAAAWWEAMLPVFTEAFTACGISAGEAPVLALQVRSAYTDLAGWKLFEDTAEVLRELRAEGWRHAILSNHVPELPSLIGGLGLAALIDRVFNSAETGFEKPHPRAFRDALSALQVDTAWMIGDNIEADVLGAERAGMRAILVRNQDARAARQAAGLREVRRYLEEPGTVTSLVQAAPSGT